MVVPEQLDRRTAFADSKRAGSKYSDRGLTNQVETKPDATDRNSAHAWRTDEAVPPCMAEAIDSAGACNRSSLGTSNVLSRSLSRNLTRSAAVFGGRSISIAGIFNPVCQGTQEPQHYGAVRASGFADLSFVPEQEYLRTALMKTNPPTAADAPLVARMAKIGLMPGQDYDLRDWR